MKKTRDTETQAVTPAPAIAGVPEAQRFIDSIWGDLTENQRSYLAVRGQCGSDAEAAEKCGFQPNRPSKWKHESPAFALANMMLLAAPLAYAQARLRNLTPMLAQVLAEALAPDVGWKNRLKAVELAMRSTGMMTTKVDITQRTVSYEEKLVRMRLEKGLDVPEPILRELGLEDWEPEE